MDVVVWSAVVVIGLAVAGGILVVLGLVIGSESEDR